MDIIAKIANNLKLPSKISLLKSLHAGYASGGSFNTIVDLVSKNPNLYNLLKSGKSISYSLSVTGQIEKNEAKILEQYETMGKVEEGFQTLLHMNEEKLSILTKMLISMAYPVFLGFVFIMIQIGVKLFLNGIGIGLIFNFFVYSSVYFAVVVAIFIALDSFVEKSTQAAEKMTLLASCSKSGIGFETVRSFFNDRNAENYTKLASNIEGVDLDTINIIRAGECSGKLDECLERAGKTIKDKLSIKLKFIVYIVSGIFYFIVVLMIISNIFSTMSGIYQGF
ncbi:MAG: type II secretion system F family protein [Candidatus Muiribacteriota bacterium]